MYNGGLGVTNSGEDGSHHRVDNGTQVDYLLFEFDQDVTVDKAFLEYVGHDSDISIWIGDSNGAEISSLSDSLLSSYVKENNFTHSSSSRWADFNSANLTGDTVIISLSAAGETSIGNYVNIATVTAGSVSDEDQSGYTNPEGEPEPEPQ
ncbi:hypothetical protein AFK68_03070, partial [Hydrocoleum sp. CS-953]